MKTLFCLAVATAALATSASAAGRWLAEPTARDFLAAAPTKAMAAGVGGRAIARCRLTTTGETAGCVVIRETPVGHGYGAAALAIAGKYRAAPQAAESIVELPFEWWPMDTPPDWLKKPSADDLIAVWPTEAWKKSRGGSATISCMATIQGVLTDCVVLDESPAGDRFGQAAIALTPQFLMKPARFKGQPVPSTVRIPINFKAMPGMGDMPMQRRLAPVVQAWPQAPTYAEVSAAYPAKAKASKLGGRATVACDVRKDGGMSSCMVVAEEPKGQGFGKAARELARSFRMNTMGPQGKPMDDLAAQLPITFDPKMLESPVVGKPSWIFLPPAADFMAAFEPLKPEATVRALLDCEVQQGGSLSDCKVASETGPGVGAAAMSLAPKFRMSTWTAEGLPTVGARVRVPIRFDP